MECRVRKQWKCPLGRPANNTGGGHARWSEDKWEDVLEWLACRNTRRLHAEGGGFTHRIYGTDTETPHQQATRIYANTNKVKRWDQQLVEAGLRMLASDGVGYKEKESMTPQEEIRRLRIGRRLIEKGLQYQKDQT